MATDVFVDRTGRRRRVLGWLAVTSAAVLVGALGLLAAGLLTGSALPLPGWTGNGIATPGPDSAVIGPAPTPAARPTVAPPPRPRRSVSPSATPSSTGASDRPGRGVGRGNRPTDKPVHPKPKAG